MIRPDFWDDEKLGGISRDARLTFIGIWNLSDDFGVSRAHPTWIIGKLFPYDNIKPKQIESWLAELVAIGCLLAFEHNGEAYYFIPNFLKHQQISRPSKARNPEPPEFPQQNSAKSSTILHCTDETEAETEAETETEALSAKPTAPVKKSRKKPTGDHAAAIAYYMEKYSAFNEGKAYVFTGAKDGQLISDLLKVVPLLELKLAIDNLFSTKDAWIAGTDRAIGILSTKINMLRQSGISALTGPEASMVRAGQAFINSED